MSSRGVKNLSPADCRRPHPAHALGAVVVFDYFVRALGDTQARKLPEAPLDDTLKGVRDRAILATLLYHGMPGEELCGYGSGICRTVGAW